jgi:hypothetical protein
MAHIFGVFLRGVELWANKMRGAIGNNLRGDNLGTCETSWEQDENSLRTWGEKS